SQFATRPRSAERAAGGPAKGRRPDATLARLRREESTLRDQIDEMESRTALRTLERQSETSRYLPTQQPKHMRQQPAFGRVSVGPYGIPVPSQLPELSHFFSGDVLRA